MKVVSSIAMGDSIKRVWPESLINDIILCTSEMILVCDGFGKIHYQWNVLPNMAIDLQEGVLFGQIKVSAIIQRYDKMVSKTNLFQQATFKCSYCPENESAKILSFKVKPLTIAEYTYYLILIKDITKKEYYKYKYLQKSNELDSIIYQLSHMVKGPLSTIEGIVNLIPCESDERYKLLIYKELNRVNHFLNALKLLFDNEGNREEIEQFSLNSVVKKILKERYTLGISVQLISNYDFTIASYKMVIHRLLYELIDNGFKFLKYAENPSLKVVLRRKEKGVMIRVSDNGPGIPKDLKSRVFEMFYRANDYEGGNGLGLYLVMRIIKVLKGNVTLKSKEGKGTSVMLYIPCPYEAKEVKRGK
ncbi:HAMP domain-containing sensor histidine kinase [Cytophagales bacterium LB-30]|uniref:histidine kinase n=1 Tax=Shiella aurantiaca TaxID=3058365 RepID=A0ABT8F546_9BACT|nr:HAMP domain-containing sensor histidine kinase [Shiella aurantiaca]MDN4165096.1 HAMP domain-containing sensor histidine kinase [Shiella aurantiaca]